MDSDSNSEIELTPANIKEAAKIITLNELPKKSPNFPNVHTHALLLI